MIMAYVRGRMRALGLNSARRSGLSEQIFSNFALESIESNLSSTDGLSKIETLLIARDGGGGTAPSSTGGALMSIQSLNIPLRVC